jgi:hypothetical protein
MRSARLAALAVGIGLACSSPSDAPPTPSPVYQAEIDGQPGFWRFVPLSPGTKEHPSQDDFARAWQLCEGPDRPGCLAGLGFYRAECSNGIDDDGDGRVDYPDDPGCAGAHALEEDPACDDDRDNDGDGLADWDGGGFTHPDPDCAGTPWRDREHPERRRRFGLPF